MIDGSSITVMNGLTIFAAHTSWWINGIKGNYKQQLTKERGVLLTEIKNVLMDVKSKFESWIFSKLKSWEKSSIL